MVPLAALWLPILLSAIIVFVASSIMHMVLPYHKGDYRQLPEEDKLLAALRGTGLTRGLYVFPYCTHKDMKSPAIVEKCKQAGGHDDRVSQRPTGDGEVSGTVVCLLSDHRIFRGVSDGAHRRARSHVSGGFPCGRHHVVYGLRARKLEQQHLEGPALVDDHKGSHRRACLRLADGGNVRLAVAALNKELWPTRPRHTQPGTLAAEGSF
jgi:hypothetical protein